MGDLGLGAVESRAQPRLAAPTGLWQTRPVERVSGRGARQNGAARAAGASAGSGSRDSSRPSSVTSGSSGPGRPVATPQRLQKVLARAGVASRRAAEGLIVEGRVSVDGVCVKQLGVRISPQADVRVDGRRVSAEPLLHLLLHKPRGVVCTLADPQGRACVADYLRQLPARVAPVGRLDYQTSGALLLTNDGGLARELLHPSRKVLKRYELKVKGAVEARALGQLRGSIDIDGRATQPALIRVLRREPGAVWLEVQLREGRNRQIRRLAERAGLGVLRLRRTHFAGLDVKALAPGQLRPLTAQELAALRSQSRSASAPRSTGAARQLGSS